jgi:hypothetical protein
LLPKLLPLKLPPQQQPKPQQLQPPKLPPLKPLPLPPPKPPLLKLPKLPLLSLLISLHNKQRRKALIPKPVLWERRPLELGLLQRALWLKPHPLLKLLWRWVDPALVRLGLRRRWKQVCKALVLRRAASLQFLKPLVVQQRPLLALRLPEHIRC